MDFHNAIFIGVKNSRLGYGQTGWCYFDYTRIRWDFRPHGGNKAHLVKRQDLMFTDDSSYGNPLKVNH